MIQRAGEDQYPFAAFLIPEHIGVAAFAFVGDHGISFVYIEPCSVVVAPCEALDLAESGGRVECNDRIFAESGSIGFIDYCAAAEYRTESVGCDSQRTMFPMHEVFADGVPPVHVLPQRPVGIVLVVKMPFAVFVKHAVRVVHPAVERCMVVQRAVWFAVGGVERIAECDFFPTDFILYITRVGTVVLGAYIQCDLLSVVWCQIERHEIVDMVYRQPFPGPGLGVRCLGAITRDRLEAVRESDAILREEFKNAGLDKKVWQYFTVVPDFKSVGVRDNARSFEWPVIIRAVNTVDAMTATIEPVDWPILMKITDRILKEVKNVNRVCYDMSPKPNATIEWE